MAATEARTSAPPPAAQARPHRHARVLVVAPDADRVRLLDLLPILGHVVCGLEDVVLADRLLASSTYDVLVADAELFPSIARAARRGARQVIVLGPARDAAGVRAVARPLAIGPFLAALHAALAHDPRSVETVSDLPAATATG